MNKNAKRLAVQIINDAESELGMMSLNTRTLMIETYADALKDVKKGGLFLAHIYDETTKKSFDRGYEVA